jgi:hypothetical protein
MDDDFASLDALARKRELLRAAARIRSALYDETPLQDKAKTDIAWVKAVQKLCNTYRIRLPVAFKSLRYSDREEREEREKHIEILIKQIAEALNTLDIEIRVDDAITGIENYIELDNDWRARAGSYVSHIREVVSKADIIESIRERILKKLNELQSEIDRNRTRVESISEVFLSITEAVS